MDATRGQEVAALVAERQVQSERYMRAKTWQERKATETALELIRTRLHALGFHGIA